MNFSIEKAFFSVLTSSTSLLTIVSGLSCCFLSSAGSTTSMTFGFSTGFSSRTIGSSTGFSARISTTSSGYLVGLGTSSFGGAFSALRNVLSSVLPFDLSLNKMLAYSSCFSLLRTSFSLAAF